MTLNKEYLKEHRRKRIELENSKTRLELLYSKTGLRSPSAADGMPHAHNAMDSMGETVYEIVKLENEIKKCQEIIRIETITIDGTMTRLSPLEKQVITYRYIDCLEWDEVIGNIFGRYTDYSYNKDKYKDKVFRIHGAALKHIRG